MLTPENHYRVLGLPEPRFRLVPLRVKAMLATLYVFGLIILVNFKEPIQRFWDSVAHLFSF